MHLMFCVQEKGTALFSGFIGLFHIQHSSIQEDKEVKRSNYV